MAFAAVPLQATSLITTSPGAAKTLIGDSAGVVVEVSTGGSKVGLSVAVGVEVGLGSGVGVKVSVGDTLEVGVSVGVSVEVILGVGVSVGIGAAVEVSVKVGAVVAVSVGGSVGRRGVGVRVGVSVGSRVRVEVSAGVGVAVDVSMSAALAGDTGRLAVNKKPPPSRKSSVTADLIDIRLPTIGMATPIKISRRRPNLTHSPGYEFNKCII